jgi:hypothetical protein
MRKVYIFLIVLAISFFLISCKESSSTSPTTTTSATTSSTTTSSTTTVSAKPVTIRETGVGYDTIGEAIDAASDGQHIDVSAGTYIENLVIGKLLYLNGEERNTTIIDGSYSGIVVKFETDAEGSDIRGFTIKNSANCQTGIYCNSVLITIGRNVVKNNYYGIESYSPSGEISGVIIEDNASEAIYLHGGARPAVVEVAARRNYRGIDCSGASPKISGCTVTDNSQEGIVCYGSAIPDVGSGAQGSPGNNTIRNNGNFDFRNTTGNPIMAENNRWDHTLAADIDSQDIYDDDENASYGAVDFQPFKTSVSFVSFGMKSRLGGASALFKDFLNSLVRGDLPAAAISISPSLEAKLYIVRHNLLQAKYHSFAAERYYPPLMVRARR